MPTDISASAGSEGGVQLSTEGLAQLDHRVSPAGLYEQRVQLGRRNGDGIRTDLSPAGAGSSVLLFVFRETS